MALLEKLKDVVEYRTAMIREAILMQRTLKEKKSTRPEVPVSKGAKPPAGPGTDSPIAIASVTDSFAAVVDSPAALVDSTVSREAEAHDAPAAYPVAPRADRDSPVAPKNVTEGATSGNLPNDMVG